MAFDIQMLSFFWLIIDSVQAHKLALTLSIGKKKEKDIHYFPGHVAGLRQKPGMDG